MKLSEIKHNHSLTDLLKVFIFSILMLLPFLSVLTRCMYVTFNKNAYQSYSGTTWTQTQEVYYSSNEVNSINDMTVGNIYTLTSIGATSSTPRGYINGEIIAIIETTNIQSETTTPVYQVPYIYGVDDAIIRYVDNNERKFLTNAIVDFVFNGTIANLENLLPFISECTRKYVKEYIQVQQQETLDNVFEYSFQRMSQDDMFNWTQNTALYSGIHTMTTNLQIQTNVIAILLTYWTILTIVYVIIDIVLKCFTLLTHGFSRKTS